VSVGSRGTACVLSLVLVWGIGCKDRTLKPDDEKKEQKTRRKETKERPEPEVEPDPDKPATVGLVGVETDKSVEEVASGIVNHFEEESGMSVVADIDHSKNAESADLELPPTRMIAVTHAQLDMSFVDRAKRAGLDFPHKILVWGSADGPTRVHFNAPAYVAKRHGIEKLGLQLGQQEEKLSAAIEEATGTAVPDAPKRDAIGIDAGQGVVTLESNNGVSDTFEKLRGLVEEKDGVSVMSTVDYPKLAEGLDVDLTPAKLVMLGNPKLGTPLMAKARGVGLDLPQKIFVYGTKKGAIKVAYNDPTYLAMRHGFDGETEEVERIAEALEELAEEACKEIE